MLTLGFQFCDPNGCQFFGTIYMDLEIMPFKEGFKIKALSADWVFKGTKPLLPLLPSFNYYRFISKCLSLGPSQLAQW